MTGRIKQGFANSRESLASAGSAVTQKTRRAMRKTDYYVHDNAWKMLGMAASLAFAAGFFLSRATEERYLLAEGVPVDTDHPRNENKSGGSWELVHAAIPLALFAWKAFQGSRCAKRNGA